MICPKCKSENQKGNFCSHCGNPLREKCPECGKMESIGRPVCETKVAKEKQEKKRKIQEIWQEREDYIWNEINKLIDWERVVMKITGFLLIISLSMLLFAIFIAKNPWSLFPFIGSIVIFIGSMIILFAGMPLAGKIDTNRKKRFKIEFYDKFPEKAEILRKGEIIK